MTHTKEELLKEGIDMFVAPMARSIVSECVNADAEYKGTVRLNASAIPLFRWVSRVYDSAVQTERERLLKETVSCVPEVQELPKSPCINLENHMFGSCFVCEKMKGWNACREEMLSKINALHIST